MVWFIVLVLILAGLCIMVYSRKKADQGKNNHAGTGEPGIKDIRAEGIADQKSLDSEAGNRNAAGSAPDFKDQGQDKSVWKNRSAEKKRKEKTAAAEEITDSRREEAREDARKTAKPRPVRTEKEEAASEIYDCINKSLRKASISWARGEMDQLKELGTLSLSVRKYYDEILQSLRDEQKEMLRHYRDAVDLQEREDQLVVSSKEDADLEKLLFDSMMPFYPYYGKELQAGGIRYGSMLSKETLALFHQLTGRKFRIGFHRRYRSGVDSFDWKGNHYQVRDPEGRLFCDADFTDGKLVSGYARMPAEQDSDDNWKVYQAGIWEDGRLKDGTICYQYQKKVR